VTPWKYVGGVRVCFDPLNVTLFHSKLLLDNSSKFHIIKDETKMEGKTNCSRRLKQFDGLTWLTLTPTLFYDRSTQLAICRWIKVIGRVLVLVVQTLFVSIAKLLCILFISCIFPPNAKWFLAHTSQLNVAKTRFRQWRRRIVAPFRMFCCSKTLFNSAMGSLNPISKNQASNFKPTLKPGTYLGRSSVSCSQQTRMASECGPMRPSGCGTIQGQGQGKTYVRS